MRFRPICWLCFGLGLGLSGAVRATPLEDEVRFWEARSARDIADAISPTFEGEACLKLVRATARMEWETKAEAALRTALARNPEYVPALVALSALCLRRHAFAEAAKWADEAVRLEPEQAVALAARGDVRLETGQLAEARADYRRVAEKAPGLGAESRLARLQFLEGQPKEAAAALERALNNPPAGARPETLAQVELQLGELRFRSGDYAGATALYRQAQQHAPELPVVLDHQAELEAAEGQAALARGRFEALARRTLRPEYQQAVGDLLKSAGDETAARAWHDQALQGYLEAARHDDPRYDHHLATFYSDVRRDAAAAVKWARLDFARRQTAFTMDSLAWALHLDGQPAEARKLLDRALATGIQDAQLFFHAAIIVLAEGDKQAGGQWLASAAAVNPHFQAYHFHR
ncbi:MAG TPA: tetratricopeptide repeat protein [Candidatus Limnocylindria bacterium]|jgi:tetratricopeptide (TPR) repeat protein|nr:tetratricopeptide repeat protein [Candidatus Limnocylindria bacterium]